MRTDRRRVRWLLLAVFVPVLIVIGVLASAVLGQSGARSDGPGALPRPQPSPAAQAQQIASGGAVHSDAPGAPGAPRAERPFAPDVPFVPEGAERLDVGAGARGAAIFRPRGAAGTATAVVIFLHGWVAIDPGRYGPWIGHLVRGGSTVIFPVYQTKPAYDTRTPLANVLAGVRAALGEVVLAPGRLVVAGHSVGGALAADYAAVAGDHGLPAPAAVFSVYPGRKLRHLEAPVPTVDLMRIAPGTRLLALAGERDTAVGSIAARRIVEAAARARARASLVTVRDDAVDLHRSPRSFSQAAQRTFWAPLDALIAATQPANHSVPSS